MSSLPIYRAGSPSWQPKTFKKTLAHVVELRPFVHESVASARPDGVAGIPGLGTFRWDPDGSDRKLLDALLGIGLVIVLHAAVIDHFKHQPVDSTPPKEEKVEITLLAPPPPPPPVVQPQPRPAPVKDAIPPKPKPKPKKLPPPVIQQPPVQTNAPVDSDAPPAPVHAAPVAPPAPPVEKVVQLTSADYLRNPPPDYPQDAQDRGWEGKVLLKVRILPSGKPDVVQVQKSSGHATLDSAAVKAVRGGWLFKPNMQGTTATAVWVVIPIVFQL